MTQDAVTIGSRLPVSGKPIERPAGGASNYQAANEEAVDLEWVPTRGIGEARFEPDRFRPAACKNDTTSGNEAWPVSRGTSVSSYVERLRLAELTG